MCLHNFLLATAKKKLFTSQDTSMLDFYRDLNILTDSNDRILYY